MSRGQGNLPPLKTRRKMATPNYKQIETLLANRQTFTHGYSMRAELEGNTYVVYSYNTVIARYFGDTGKWWVNENKYSVTTSKQQNIIKRVARQHGWISEELEV